MIPRLTPISEEAWDDDHIPQRLVSLVRYLNKIVAIDAQALTALLDEAVSTHVEGFEKAFPHMVLRRVGREHALISGLGLLSGFVNSGQYRIFASFKNDKEPHGPITGFGIFFVSEVPDDPAASG